MPSIVLKNLSNPIQLSNTDSLDLVKPFSFSQWQKNHTSIIPSDAEVQYQKYLSDWYSSKISTNDLTVANSKLKEDYISLLKQLSVLFQNDETFNRISNIDFNDKTQLAISIPFFARKLKEIAQYYASKREDIKRSKLKYNMTGSSNGLERILYDSLLSAFTKKPQTLTIQKEDIYNNVPELSSIKDDFYIEIEELYDDKNYFETEEQKYTRVSTNPLLREIETWSELLIANINGYDSTDYLNGEILGLLNEKYLGNNLYYLSGGYYAPSSFFYEMNFEEGSNMFYWFSGTMLHEIPEGQFSDISINDINWSNATAGTELSSSDVIITEVGNKKFGAWYNLIDNITVNTSISALLKNETSFIFPFPGKGTIDENGVYTGKTISNLDEDKIIFNYDGISSLIEKEYWSNNDSISSCNAISIHETSLITNGATFHKKKNNADSLVVEKANDGTKQSAFLYNLKSTQIPIKSGENNIYYPLSTFDSFDNVPFTFSFGDNITLSSLDSSVLIGAIGGNSKTNSDVIYQIENSCGTEIGAAYLKCEPLSAYNELNKENCNCNNENFFDFYTGWKFKTGFKQNSLNLKISAGSAQRFVWNDEDTLLSNVIKPFNHDESCSYNGKDFRTCSCGAIYYSPSNGDIVIKDIEFPNTFSKNTWKGSDNLSYTTSVDSVYFNSNNWSNDFTLEKGKVYQYYRTDNDDCKKDSPEIYIKYAHTISTGTWKKMIKNITDETWKETDEPSDMIISPGTYLKYNHYTSPSFSLEKLLYNGNEIDQISGTFVSLSATDTSISYLENTINESSNSFLWKNNLNENTSYWAKYDLTSYNDQFTRKLTDGLYSSQPLFSDIIFENGDLITYNSKNCFIWTEPLTFNVKTNEKQWNKLLIDDCSESEILNFIENNNCQQDSATCYSECANDVCDTNGCFSTKRSLSATNELSDMIFNVELSGIPVFVNYYAQSAFSTFVEITDITENKTFINGVSGLYARAEFPWKNLTISDGTYIIDTQNDSLSTKNQIGLFLPKNLGTGKYELRSAIKELDTNNRRVSSFDVYDVSPEKVVSIDYSWSKNSLGIPVLNGKQSYVPYTTHTELNKNPYLGFWDMTQKFSPWTKNGKWNEQEDYPLDFRNNPLIEKWYNDQINYNGNFKQWQTDVYGNQYFLMTDDSTTRIEDSTSFGELFVKLSDGTILNGYRALSSVFARFNNVNFGLSSNNDYLISEDGLYVIDENGNYIVLN